MTTATTTCLADVHPVELLILLFWLPIVAVLQVITDPPRPMRPQAASAGGGSTFLRQPQACAAPVVGRGPVITVAELRTMARQQGITSAGGRPIHKARRADLLSTLGLT